MVQIACSFFVDDFALCVSRKTLNRMERAMQLCVNSVQDWTVFSQTLTLFWEKRL